MLGELTFVNRSLENWRPITLLNCDYKIIAATLATRLQSVIGEIVNEDQTGYIKNRLSAFNIRLTIDIIEFMKRKHINGAIMMADFSKAFDVIDFNFVSSCLEAMNFGTIFQTWIKILYTDIRSSVLVNGWISESFSIQRGIRQGCPLSALLFVLAAEFMSNRIRNNKFINGIHVLKPEENCEVKLLQYANDTVFFMWDKRSLEIISEELELFGKVAGPKLNKSKTAVMWLGNSKNT